LVRTTLEGEARGLVKAAAGLPAKRFAGLRAAVLSWVQWALGRPSLYGLVAAIPGTGLGETNYKEPSPLAGMPAFCAAAARRHAGLAEGAVEGLQLRASDRTMALQRHAKPASCVPVGGGTSGFLRYPVLVGTDGHSLAIALSGTVCGAVRGYPEALPMLGAAAGLQAGACATVPGAERLARRLVTLPTHRWVSPNDLKGIDPIGVEVVG
ncbi:MAG: hypothetical protein ABL963_05060, partial [Longimicrobiales bacterium]